MVFVIVNTPWPISKGLDHSYLHVYACLLLCFMLVLVTLVLGFARLDTLSGFVVMWLYPMSMWPYLDVTIRDALPRCRLLHAYLFPFPLHALICLPCLFVPHVGFWCIFTHLLTCLCMSLLASVSSILQHNEAIVTQSKPTFVPRGHHLLFACLLVCLFACLLVISLVCLITCLLASLFLYLPYLSCLSASCLYRVLFAYFPSIACLLVSCLCLCMYTDGMRTYGAKALSPRHKQKGWGCKHVNISQTAMLSRFRSLAYPIWLYTILNPLPSSLISLLDGLY